VDVVILTWNDGELLEAAIRSVEASVGVQLRLVVVDNASSPPANVASSLPITWIRNEENRGVAAARNQGAAAGRAPLLCFLDSDARLQPGSLQLLVAALEGPPGVALAAPTFVDQAASASAGPAPTLRRKVLRVLNLRDTYATGSNFAGGVRDVDFAIGACQVVRRAAFEQVGGLDEGYFYGPEDVDFCLRLREAGWRVLQVAGARVHHPPRRRFRGLATRRGLQHAHAVARHLWRHRGFQRRVGRVPV
jgi:GT2 family glycosyltransferase